MLTLVSDTKRKKDAQAALEHELKGSLKRLGIRNIGFPGGNVDQTMYSAGKGELWVAFSGPSEDFAVPRYWNAFGIYDPNRPAQTIAVEINIPSESNSAQVAGFFAEDNETGDIFLMHSGKVGGGRLGIGKSEFLFWSKAKLVDVAEKDGGIRSGIPICKLNDSAIVGRILAFVKRVQSFKGQAAAGGFNSPAFKQQVKEFDRYSKEFSGKKSGVRGGPFEYVTYHGDIVQKLYDDRISRVGPGEKVFNSPLIDLFVKKRGVLSEVYEVKTGGGRQMLYTAIGQIVTHATISHNKVAKFLVIPADESIPKDLKQAIGVLGIEVRRFKLSGPGRSRTVELL